MRFLALPPVTVVLDAIGPDLDRALKAGLEVLRADGDHVVRHARHHMDGGFRPLPESEKHARLRGLVRACPCHRGQERGDDRERQGDRDEDGHDDCDGRVERPYELLQAHEEEHEGDLEEEREQHHDLLHSPSHQAIMPVLADPDVSLRYVRHIVRILAQPLLQENANGRRNKTADETREPERVDDDQRGGHG